MRAKFLKVFNMILLVTIVLISCIMFLGNDYQASNINTDLIVQNLSNEFETVNVLKNVKNYATNILESKTKSLLKNDSLSLHFNKLALAKNLYSQLGFYEEEIDNMSESKLLSILNVQNAKVVRRTFQVLEDNNLQVLPVNSGVTPMNVEPEQELTYNNNLLYFIGESYQDPTYDYYMSEQFTKSNGDVGTKIKEFYEYGFRIEFDFRWAEGDPAWRLKDQVHVNWTSDVRYDLHPRKPKREYDPNYNETWEQSVVYSYYNHNNNLVTSPLSFNHTVVSNALSDQRPYVRFDSVAGHSRQGIHISLILRKQYLNGYNEDGTGNRNFYVNAAYLYQRVYAESVSVSLGASVGDNGPSASAGIGFNLTNRQEALCPGAFDVQCDPVPSMENIRASTYS